jgi:predicted membrane chloride channel (bestrophin family)
MYKKRQSVANLAIFSIGIATIGWFLGYLCLAYYQHYIESRRIHSELRCRCEKLGVLIKYYDDEHSNN